MHSLACIPLPTSSALLHLPTPPLPLPAPGCVRRAQAEAERLRGEIKRLSALPDAALDAEVKTLKEAVDVAYISAVAKAALRDDITGLSKRVLEAAKVAAAENKTRAVASAVAAADAVVAEGKPFLVLRVDVGLDTKATTEAVAAVAAKHPSLPAMLLSVDVEKVCTPQGESRCCPNESHGQRSHGRLAATPARPASAARHISRPRALMLLIGVALLFTAPVPTIGALCAARRPRWRMLAAINSVRASRRLTSAARASSACVRAGQGARVRRRARRRGRQDQGQRVGGRGARAAGRQGRRQAQLRAGAGH